MNVFLQCNQRIFKSGDSLSLYIHTHVPEILPTVSCMTSSFRGHDKFDEHPPIKYSLFGVKADINLILKHCIHKRHIPSARTCTKIARTRTMMALSELCVYVRPLFLHIKDGVRAKEVTARSLNAK